MGNSGEKAVIPVAPGADQLSPFDKTRPPLRFVTEWVGSGRSIPSAVAGLARVA